MKKILIGSLLDTLNNPMNWLLLLWITIVLHISINYNIELNLVAWDNLNWLLFFSFLIKFIQSFIIRYNIKINALFN
jgi:hypothetical protein